MIPDAAVLVEHLAHHALEPLEPGRHALGRPVLDGLGRVLAEVRAGLLQAVCAWPVWWSLATWYRCLETFIAMW